MSRHVAAELVWAVWGFQIIVLALYHLTSSLAVADALGAAVVVVGVLGSEWTVHRA